MALSFELKTATDWLHKTVARIQVASDNHSGTENQPETQSSIAGAETVVTENEFQTLTPIVDPDKEGYQPYFKALDYALSRDDVKNIAITGPYGAGKSSVILSYLKKIEGRKRLWHRLKYWLRFTSLKPADEHVIISLANFETDETLKSSESLSKEQSIEYSILQQILYKVDKGTLPDSRVERIHTRSVGQILTTSCLLFFVLALAIVVTTLLFPQKIVSTFSLSPAVSHFIAIHPIWRWGCIGSLSFIICWYLLSRFYRIGFFDRKIALDKVNLLKAEIAAEKQNTASLLNLYIDEIVYFFLKTKYRVVVFEDLDRLNNGHIFIKLREINQVVNNSRLLEKKPIKFIFAVREDLLKDAESQTKFFDFIVPIIPAIDSENAYDILSSKVINFNSADKEQFFKKVSLYLTDMRVMNNVINEFNIFKKLITGELSDVKLFSLIMYKNLCTKDFTQLDNQRGFLFRVVHAYSRKTLHDLYFQDFEKTFLSLKSRVEQARKELHDSKETLRGELLQRYLPGLIVKNACFYSYNNQYNNVENNCTYADLVEHEALFIRFLERNFQSGVVIFNSRNRNYEDHYEISSDKRSELLQEYKRRYPVVEDNNSNSLNSLLNKISDVQSIINAKRNVALHELSERITLSKFREWLLNDGFDENKLSGKPDNTAVISFNIELLFFMLSNGYIEQDYMQYRSIFHTGALSKSDNVYIQKVAAKVNFEELKDIHLNNVSNVVDKMESLSFKYYEGVFHPHIISFLINCRVDFARDVFIHLFNHCSHGLIIRTMRTYFYEFSNDDYQDLINLILSDEKTLGKLMAAMSTYRDIDSDDDFYQQLSVSFLRFGLIENIARQRAVQDYLHELKTGTTLFTYIQPDEIASFSIKLKALNIVFDSVNEANDESERALVKFIAENFLYVFNINNLTALFNAYSDNRKNVEELSRHPYTLIMSEKVPCLTEAVNKNIEMFILEYFIHSEESVESVISLINSDVTEHSKEVIIENMDFEVQQLSTVENIRLSVVDGASFTVYDLLFKHGRVAANWDNIFDYMYTDVDDEILWAFFSHHPEALSGHKVSVPEESVDNVVNHIISAADKPDALYAQLISVLPVNIDQAISDLPLTKFKALCDSNRVLLSEALYEDVLSIYEGQRRKGLNKCLSFMIRNNVAVFESNIEFYLQDDEDFDNELIELVLNDDDIALTTKVSIIDIIWPHYINSFFDHISVNSKISMALLLNVSEDDTRLVFLNHLLEFEELPFEYINRALMAFVSEEYNLITDKTKRAKVLKTEGNEILLKYLTHCYFISSYKDKGKSFEVYHYRKTFLDESPEDD
ncbi:P-loop NTPase fold protein [Pectobacterium sp. CHL-2024]|uniref:YobI family P-loop NTPase n=1 Tax=Pectobacterium sp. CHL-2024 TaxID=3377079 RepID=UPI003801A53C